MKKRLKDNAQWPLTDGIVVVLFAGMGGACAGLEDAGLPVHVANNHNPVALAAHAALHPHTSHIKGDIFDVDPLVATRGRPVNVLWASPDCRDHSVAKGGAPRSARVRSLPWQICRWAGKTKPKVIFCENVREIRGWGPLIAKRDPATGRVLKLDGTIAAPGERVPVQQQQLVRDKTRTGRSYRRLIRHLEGLGYTVATRDLNCADYGVPTSRKRWFLVARRDGHPIGWPARTHAPRDQAAALGLLPWRGACEIIDWSIPIPSIFERKRELAPATLRRVAKGLKRYVLDNPHPYIIPITHHGERRVHPLNEPIPTLTTAHRGEYALVSPNLTKFQENSIGQDVRAPIDTLMAGAPRFGVVAASMVQAGYGEAPGQQPRTLDIEQPLGTVVAGGCKHALVGAFMAQHNLGATGHPCDEPLSTLTTRCTQQQVVSAIMTGCGGRAGQVPPLSVEDPVRTLTTKADQVIASACLAELRGTSTANDAAEPLPTQTAGGNHTACVAAFMTKYYSAGEGACDVTNPLDTVTTHDRFNVVTVTIDGQPYVVSDIGMRMLRPREAAAAHELTLPDTVTLVETKRDKGAVSVTRKLTDTEITFLVGNSVPKRMATLLAQCNAVPLLYGVAEAAE